MILSGFVTALRTLTILPVPGREARHHANSLYYFPIVGVIIGGLIQLAVWFFARRLDWPIGAAFAGVVVSVWVTRALHLDGLSDTVDACLAARTRGHRLEIMKDPHIGVFGATAVILALLCKAVALERLCLTDHLSWIPVPVILSRMVMVLTASSLPYARLEGGKAQPFVAEAGSSHFWVACALAVCLCGLQAGGYGLFATAIALTLGLLAIRWMKRAFGGTTGDLLGFTGETVECALYFILASISTFL